MVPRRGLARQWFAPQALVKLIHPTKENNMKIACTAAVLGVALAFPVLAQSVKITPIGSHPGELCANDRATIFEDPTGVRILYDVGHTLTGADDERLGTVHVVLLSHATATISATRSSRRSARAPAPIPSACPR